MRTKLVLLLCLVSCFAVTASLLAQEGHPLKGSWRGDWGPSATHRNHIVVVMDWDGQNISGVVNPGPQAVPIKSVAMEIIPGTQERPAANGQPAVAATPPTFKVRIEAEARDRNNAVVNFVAEGTIEDLGLPNRSLVGTWTHGDVRGDFRITRQ